MAGIIKVDRVQSDSNLAFQVGSTNVAFFDVTDGVKLGTTKIGTGSITTDGIVFPATQVPSTDANTLDDYEEGTFNPSLAFLSGQTGSFGASRYTCRYAKIGRIVHVQGWVAWAGKPTGGSFLTITLPFAPENSGDARGGFNVTYSDMVWNATVYHWAIRTEGDGTSICRFNYQTGTAGVMTVEPDYVTIPTNGSFMFSGTYFAAA